jgi:hypothetical protein
MNTYVIFMYSNVATITYVRSVKLYYLFDKNIFQIYIFCNCLYIKKNIFISFLLQSNRAGVVRTEDCLKTRGLRVK